MIGKSNKKNLKYSYSKGSIINLDFDVILLKTGIMPKCTRIWA